MRMRWSKAAAAALVIMMFGLTGCNDTIIGGDEYQRDFALKDCKMTPTGRNGYFVLEPGFQLVLEGGGTKVEINILDETKQIDGITTRVVEEKEWKDGELYEIARNYFAICEGTKDVFYFGEDVDFYEDGKVVKHDGTWLHGKDGAKAGIIMPGTPKLGQKYYQEVAPGVAMDRGEIVSLDETCKTPAGTFSKCMKVKELSSLDFWTSLMFWEAEYKMHVPKIGLVQDEELLLTKHGFVGK